MSQTPDSGPVPTPGATPAPEPTPAPADAVPAGSAATGSAATGSSAAGSAAAGSAAGSAAAPGPGDDGTVVEVRRSRTYRPGDMVRSMLVILAIVGLLVLVVPRPNTIPQRAIDVPAAASASVEKLGFTPVVPQLPAGWTAKTADVRRGTDNLQTWHLSYVTPSSNYAGVQQTRNATEAWTARQVTDGGDQGTHSAGGVEWTVRSREDRGITSWVRTDGDVTTVVTGTTTAAELNDLAAAVVPGLPAQSS